MKLVPGFRERINKGAEGEKELEQIVSVLFSRFLASLGRDPTITQLGSGIWFGSRTLCVCAHSPTANDVFGKPSDFAKDLDTLVFASSEAQPVVPEQTERSLRETLKKAGWKRAKSLQIRIWNPEHLLDLLTQVPSLCLRYYPELIQNGKSRAREILSLRSSYNQELAKLNGEIQFVGMSVYKEEAAKGVEMEKIYIPLRVVPEGTSSEVPESEQTNPLSLLSPGSRRVILGDPGSGKSTLVRFLALAGLKPRLFERYGARKDDRLPIVIILRRYAEELKAHPESSLLDHAIQVARADLALPSLDTDFFEYFLLAGQGLLFLDGVDELPNPEVKETVRSRVANLLASYPGNAVVVTSRIVGYDKEARLDSLGFSHHCIAKLSLEDIETFVHDWYRARISNKAERERHAKDLVRILRDPESRAIRELAENPLLLTIICLVHRIDAELPDERVVLYQKCTETLLNTWHTWKFQRESVQSRNKVEQRNRSRMEAIAHWMHGSLEAAEEVRRAVVPYEDLRDFLTNYIKEIEGPKGEDPLDLAETFLRFVKERAGLLIEVGSGQYSFVHLTFQEYLTATHVRKSGETFGMPAIWPFIENHCDDPKWHEVFRLLLGSLERAESQKYLLERILAKEGEDGAFERVLLAGGCLIDGVDAAEAMREEILLGLLYHAANAQSLDRFRRVLRMLRTWVEHVPDNKAVLRRLAREALEAAPNSPYETGLALSLAALGWSVEEVAHVSGCLKDDSHRAGWVFRSICLGELSESFPESGSELMFLQAFITWASLRSPGMNFCAAALAALCLPQPTPKFSLLLACIGGASGPFRDFFLNTLRFTPELELFSIRDQTRTMGRSQHRGLDLEEIRDMHRGKWAWAKAQDRARALNRVRALDLTRDAGEFRTVYEAGKAVRFRRPFRLFQLRAVGKQLSGSSILADEVFHTPILDLLCNLLSLQPVPQWWEVLRVRALHHVPERITLANKQVWDATLQSWIEERADQIDEENAASQLLLDTWLWLNHHHQRPEDSLFARLAEVTRSVDSAPLKVAHCIRDIAHGNQSRIEILKDMMGSNDPAYRKLFEDACWREPQTREKQPRSRKGR